MHDIPKQEQPTFLQALLPNLQLTYIALASHCSLPTTGDLYLLSKDYNLNHRLTDGDMFANHYRPKENSDGVESFVNSALKSDEVLLGIIPVMDQPTEALKNDSRFEKVVEIKGNDGKEYPLFKPK
jgi:hypothetical protein